MAPPTVEIEQPGTPVDPAAAHEGERALAQLLVEMALARPPDGSDAA